MIVFAHISDLHLDGGERNAERAARVMSYLNGFAQPVDAVLVTGDIADHGLAAEYEEVRALLDSCRYPVLALPGNHDERAAFRAGLLGERADNTPINRVQEVSGAVFALCDSTIPGRNDGLLADETLLWLESVLAGTPTGVPVFVCFHHPPVLVHNEFIDGLRQFGESRLAELAQRHPQVVAFLCGHAHTAAATTFAGRPLLVGPSVANSLLLPWESEENVSYDLPPGVALHILEREGRLTTHYRVVV